MPDELLPLASMKRLTVLYSQGSPVCGQPQMASSAGRRVGRVGGATATSSARVAEARCKDCFLDMDQWRYCGKTGAPHANA